MTHPALAPQPMSPAEVADLVERVRAVGQRDPDAVAAPARILHVALADLPAAFAAARIPTPRSEPRPNICRYCGKRWIPGRTNPYDGHTWCLVTVEFQRQVCALYYGTPTLSMQSIADAIGVKRWVVDAWVERVRSDERSAARRNDRGPR